MELEVRKMYMRISSRWQFYCFVPITREENAYSITVDDITLSCRIAATRSSIYSYS
jgi:hypothetical protein